MSEAIHRMLGQSKSGESLRSSLGFGVFGQHVRSLRSFDRIALGHGCETMSLRLCWRGPMPANDPIPLDYRSSRAARASNRQMVLSTIEWVLFTPVLVAAVWGALIVLGSLLVGEATPLVILGAFVGSVVLTTIGMITLAWGE